VSCVVR